uniref:Protein phosphatase 1 regulatory subunit 3A n=1 Tax=Nothoprocta perdicaria TaxID=30464 RepID=A0A8C6ZVV2_NOTPE
MESFEGPRRVSGHKLLEIPTLNDFSSEDEDVKSTLKPRFSPLPRRRSSASSEEEEADPPGTIARKVSFADAFGFDLVSVKEFDTWEVPVISQNDYKEDDVFPEEEFFLSQLFTLPASQEELLQKVREQKVLLESIVFQPGVTCMNGIIRVLNISFEKTVYVRMTLDDWRSYYDILAEFMPNSCGNETDQFCFKISLVPPYQKDGAKVEFCIRYETSAGIFWANNDDKNYTLICHRKENAPKKILKYIFVNFSETNIPEIVYTQVEDKDTEPANENIKGKNAEYNRGDHGDDEKELELLLNQHFTGARGTSSRDERNLYTTEPVNFPNETEGLERKLTYIETSSDLLRHPVPIKSASGSKMMERLFISEDAADPSEEAREMNPETSEHDESVQLNARVTEALDGNANPAPEHQATQMPHQTLDSSSSHADKNEGKIKMIESKGWGHLRGDLYADNLAHSAVSIDATKSQYTHRTEVGEMSPNYNTETEKEKKVIEVADLALIGEEEVPIPFNSYRKHTAETLNTTFLSTEGNHCVPRPAQTDPLTSSPAEERRPEDTQEHRGFTRLKDRGKSDHKNQGRMIEKESESNILEQIREQTDSEVRWGMSSNTGFLNTASTKELFTCQETESCEKSSVSEHGITGKAEAGTAYIIKTTSESTPEKMSAGEKAVIAKLPQETALSDRPTEEKETAFDTHEGRNDGSHYALCQLNTVGVLYDTEFEKESVLDIYNARVHETLQGETMSVCNSREKRAKAEPDIGNILPVEQAARASASAKKEALGQGFYSEEASKYPLSVQKHLYSKEAEEREEESYAGTLSELCASFETKMPSSGANAVPIYHSKSSFVTASAESTEAGEHPYRDFEFAAIDKAAAESGYNSRRRNEMTCINKILSPEAERKEVPSSSDIKFSRKGRGRNIGQCFHQAEFKRENSLRPGVLISEPTQEVEGAGSESDSLITEGNTLNWLDDSEDEKQHISGSAAISHQKNEEHEIPSESPALKHIGYKICYFFFFLVFAGTLYHYDLMVCLALYLFSLYWLYWEGARSKEAVKKE